MQEKGAALAPFHFSLSARLAHRQDDEGIVQVQIVPGHGALAAGQVDSACQDQTVGAGDLNQLLDFRPREHADRGAEKRHAGRVDRGFPVVR